MKGAWTIAIVPALLFCAPAVAQDVRGLEVCTAEKDLARRTSCLQANVEFLQQELIKETRRAKRQADDDRANAVKEITTLKADIVALRILLSKAQDEIEMLRKKPAEKK
jgi:septal ring factor EnvC (AmiA/AmiB activator)